MLEYDKTDTSEGIDINKTNASKECDICHYCIIDIFKIEALSMSHIYAMVVMIQCQKL